MHFIHVHIPVANIFSHQTKQNKRVEWAFLLALSHFLFLPLELGLLICDQLGVYGVNLKYFFLSVGGGGSFPFVMFVCARVN